MSTPALPSPAEALEELGATPDLLTAEERSRLDEHGFVIRHDALDAAQQAALPPAATRLTYEQRVWGMEHPPDPGCETVWGITQKDPDVASMVLAPFPWAAAAHVLGTAELIGGNGDYRSPMPGSGMQRWRRVAPAQPGRFDQVVVLYAALGWDPHVAGVRIVPGSHRWEHGPEDEPGGAGWADRPDQVLLGAPAGAVIVVNAACWHSSGINASTGKRFVLTASIHRVGSPGAPRRLDPLPAPLHGLPPAGRALLGTNTHLDGTITADGKPCWCCGVERRCLRGGLVAPADLVRDEHGVVVPPDDSMAAFGFSTRA